jgi:hypothetical protein
MRCLQHMPCALTGAVTSSCVVDSVTGRELLMLSMDPERPVNRSVLQQSGGSADKVQQLEGQDTDMVSGSYDTGNSLIA